jgi:hypothetical protein
MSAKLHSVSNREAKLTWTKSNIGSLLNRDGAPVKAISILSFRNSVFHPKYPVAFEAFF